MISLNNVSVMFGGELLFDDVAFMINDGDRIGLVGKNGAGKSTMLRLINGDLSPEEGNVSTAKEVTLGYLQQDIDFNEGNTVMEEAELAFEQVKAIEKELDEIKEKVSTREDVQSDAYMELLTRMAELEERMAQLEGYTIQAEASKVLKGLGFSEKDFDQPTDTFSGGWRMRIELAKILLQKPDVLLLDEPTNHLDIESIIWLEGWLKAYSGAVVVVSHDKSFLDKVTNRTIEISFGKINDYKAAYSKFVKLREERIQNQEQAAKNQEKDIKRTKELINKFRAKASKASFAQALIKKLEKMEKIEVDSVDVSKMNLQFPPAPHSGKVTLRAHDIEKTYGDKEVLKEVDLEVERGEKLAFVGKNGEGKTTLAKILMGEIDHEGKVELGHKVKVGYYAQNQSDLLDENLTVYETIDKSASDEIAPKVRSLLGSFLFSGDDVNKKVKVLSGGERARVALCKLLLEPVNMLVMDEPTNHLDMTSKDLLKKALNRYDGTLIIVSHDRDFLQGLTQKVYEFRNKNIREYIGDVNAFLEKKKMDDLRDLERKKKSTEDSEKSKSKNNNNSNNSKQRHERRKELKSGIRKLKNNTRKLEKNIETLEKELGEINIMLQDSEKFDELSAREGFFDNYEKQKAELDKLMKEWEKEVEKLGEMEKEFKLF